MIILAGVAISLTLKDNGIFLKAKMARNEYQKSAEEEKNEIDDAYGEIMLATNDDAKITMSMKDLNTLIKNKIAEATPDYANGQEITFTNSTYTVENDGYIQLRFNYTAGVSDVNDALYINARLVFNNAASVVWQNPCTPIFQVKKGDVIRYTNRAQQVFGTYYPYR